MVDTINKKFKIIDFGFSSIEPFLDYVSDIKGGLPKVAVYVSKLSTFS